MPRRNRFHIPGLVWHITHRCHDRDFLLRFVQDRRRWRYWLHQAVRRYRLCVLNYIATSNHVHLLAKGDGSGSISKSMQLIAGRTAQEFNQRKNRRGAFWEDRYFATAVSTDEHLLKCLVYIDLNMIRAGVVAHPSAWEVSGFNEIQNPRLRYRVIDHAALCQLAGYTDLKTFQGAHRQWVETSLGQNEHTRNPDWTDSIAVGSEDFIGQVKHYLGTRVQYRKSGHSGETGHFIKDAVTGLNQYFLGEN